MTLSSLFGGGGGAYVNAGGNAVSTDTFSVTVTPNSSYTRITTVPTLLNHIHIFHATNESGWAYLRLTNVSGTASINNCHTYRYLTNQNTSAYISNTSSLYFPEGIYLGTNTTAPIYVECSFV